MERTPSLARDERGRTRPSGDAEVTATNGWLAGCRWPPAGRITLPAPGVASAAVMDLQRGGAGSGRLIDKR